MFIFGTVNRCIEFILACFIRGVLLFAPFLLTFYIISWILNVSKEIIGLGLSNYVIVGIVISIILCGYFTKNIIIRFFYNLMEIIILRIPGINFIYSSFKDLTSAFVDKKIKFDRPVLVYINVAVGEKDIKRIGFITNENLDKICDNDEVAVFIPGSFSLLVSGEIYLVPKKNLKELDSKESKELLKFVVSGGFIDIKTDIKTNVKLFK